MKYKEQINRIYEILTPVERDAAKYYDATNEELMEQPAYLTDVERTEINKIVAELRADTAKLPEEERLDVIIYAMDTCNCFKLRFLKGLLQDNISILYLVTE